MNLYNELTYKCNIEEYSEFELMKLYSRILTTLKARGTIRTSNIVGEFAEWIVSNKLGLQLAHPSVKSYDAIDTGDNVKYQIKCRYEPGNETRSTREFGILRNYNPKLTESSFDFMIAIVFDNSFDIKTAYKISYQNLRHYLVFSVHQNGHKLYLYRPDAQYLEDITNQLRNEG